MTIIYRHVEFSHEEAKWKRWHDIIVFSKLYIFARVDRAQPVVAPEQYVWCVVT